MKLTPFASVIAMAPVLLVQVALCDVSEQSKKEMLKQFSYQVPSSSTKNLQSGALSPEDDSGGVVRLEVFTVNEGRDRKDFATWMKENDQRIDAEKFNWKDGGLITRKVGKKVTVETGIWPDDKGAGIRVFNFKW